MTDKLCSHIWCRITIHSWDYTPEDKGVTCIKCGEHHANVRIYI